MKKLYILITATVAALLFATDCANDPITYDGTTRVSFATATASFQVKDEPNQTLTIPLTTTVPFAEATTIKLKVTPGEAGTENGVQFQCPESIVFPAGVYSANVVVDGYYDHLVTGQKYTFTLALDSTVVTIQGSNTVAIDLARFCPFVITNFVGTGAVNDPAMPNVFGNPAYGSYEVLTSTKPGANNTLNLNGMCLSESGDPGWDMTIEFNEEMGTVTIPASDLFLVNAGQIVMMRLVGATGSANVNRPLAGTYNACEKKITFSGALVACNPTGGAYLGYFTTTPVEFTITF